MTPLVKRRIRDNLHGSIDLNSLEDKIICDTSFQSHYLYSEKTLEYVKIWDGDRGYVLFSDSNISGQIKLIDDSYFHMVGPNQIIEREEEIYAQLERLERELRSRNRKLSMITSDTIVDSRPVRVIDNSMDDMMNGIKKIKKDIKVHVEECKENGH